MGCGASTRPPEAIADRTQVMDTLTGNSFSGNVTTDGSCSGAGCHGAVEVSFGTTSARELFLVDSYMTPGVPLRERGVMNLGEITLTHSTNGEIILSNSGTREYHLWSVGKKCLKGYLQNTEKKMLFIANLCKVE